MGSQATSIIRLTPLGVVLVEYWFSTKFELGECGEISRGYPRFRFSPK